MTTSVSEWNGYDNGLFELQINAKSDACGGKFIFKTVSVFIWCETKIGYGIIRYIFRWYCWTKSWNWTDDHICNCPCPMSEMSTPEYLIYVRVLVWLRVSTRVCVCLLRISHLVLAKWRMSLSLLENYYIDWPINLTKITWFRT